MISYEMIKVVDIAEKLLMADGIAMESLRRGFLNFSAYAAKIHPQIEDLTKKPVKKGTIVVALTRIAHKMGASSATVGHVKITDLAIKSSLCSLTYVKTSDIARKVATLTPFQVAVGDIFMVAEGPTEITLVIAAKARDKIAKYLGGKPKSEMADLAAVTVQIAEKVGNASNAHFALLTSLAAHRIEVLETVSTFLEVSFIVGKANMEDAVSALSVYLKS